MYFRDCDTREAPPWQAHYAGKLGSADAALEDEDGGEWSVFDVTEQERKAYRIPDQVRAVAIIEYDAARFWAEADFPAELWQRFLADHDVLG